MSNSQLSKFSDLDKETLSQFYERKDHITIIHAFVVIILYASISLLIIYVSYAPVKIVGSLFLSAIFIGSFSAIHECVHGFFSKNRAINHFWGVFWSVPTMLNFTLFRHYHFEHHRHTGKEGDTEPQGYYKGILQYLWGLCTYWFLARFLLMSLQSLFGHFPHYIKRPRWHILVQLDSVLLFLWIAFAITVTFLFPTEMLFIYWIPLLLYFPLITVTGLYEHYDCDDEDHTRTVTSNAVFRFLYWNNNYHAEHHAFPQVPYYNLPKLHKIISKDMKYKCDSLILFHVSVILNLLKSRGEKKKRAKEVGWTLF